MPFLPVGGQAVIEGVMMRSPSRVAVAVRRADGSIALMERAFASITRRHAVLGLPVVRGAISLFEALALGISALNFSADEAVRSETPAAKRPTGMTSAQFLTVALSLALGVLLFVVLPARLTVWLGFRGRIGFGLVDGLFRLGAFVGYLLLISQWKEMRRVLGYHGAEHKAIHALEDGLAADVHARPARPRLGLRRALRLPAAEPLDAAARVHQLLLAGVERVAGGADLEMMEAVGRGRRLDGRAGLDDIPAHALEADGLIDWMQAGFHFGLLCSRRRRGTLLAPTRRGIERSIMHQEAGRRKSGPASDRSDVR